MKKLTLILALVLSVLLAIVPLISAEIFNIEAVLPASSSATFTVSRVVPGTPEVFTVVATNDLNFSTLTLDPVNFIFLPAFFWVVDIGTDGAGQPDLQFLYADTANPNGALNNGTGLGGHGTISYQKVVTNSDLTQTVTLIRGEALQQANTSGGINETDFAGGFLRVSVGIATGDPGDSDATPPRPPAEEGNAAPLTQSDAPGTYSGILTMTATFD